jgi:hypothetical protein
MKRSWIVKFGASLVCVSLLATQVVAKPKKGKKPEPEPAASASASASASAPAAVPTLSETLTGDAKAAYESGKLLYQDGDYPGALLKFQQAYETSKDPRLLWNVAVCHKNLRRYAKVLELVKRYQAEAASMMSEGDKREAADLIAAVQGFVSPLLVRSNEADAAVTLDDEPFATLPMAEAVIVDMGSRRIKVSKPGFVELTQTLQIAGNTPVTVEAKLEKEVHEGKLVVMAEPKQLIYLDGKLVGEAQWEGKVASGGHTLRITAQGKRAYQSEVVVKDKETREIRVTLEDERAQAAAGGSSTWMWITGGAVIVAGAVVGGYFLFRPKDEPAPPPVQGTIQPGIVQLPLLGWGR